MVISLNHPLYTLGFLILNVLNHPFWGTTIYGTPPQLIYSRSGHFWDLETPEERGQSMAGEALSGTVDSSCITSPSWVLCPRGNPSSINQGLLIPGGHSSYPRWVFSPMELFCSLQASGGRVRWKDHRWHGITARHIMMPWLKVESVHTTWPEILTIIHQPLMYSTSSNTVAWPATCCRLDPGSWLIAIQSLSIFLNTSSC